MCARTLASFAIAAVLVSFGIASSSLAGGVGTMKRTELPPMVTGLQAFRDASACAQHPGVPNCSDALARGLILFSWRCDNCDPAWNPVFVVNGQQASPADASVAPSKTLALTVRPDQFKTSDCVAIRMVNPANPGQSVTSSPVCLMQLPALPRMLRPAERVVLSTTPVPSNSIAFNAPALASGIKGAQAPTSLSSTLDSKICTQHGGFAGGLACAAGLPKGMLALIWSCDNCRVDGYRLFRVDGGRREPVATPANGKGVTLALLDVPLGGFARRCYAVAAYEGARESVLSNQFCASGESSMATATFTPQHVRSSGRLRSRAAGPPALTSIKNWTNTKTNLVAGTFHSTSPFATGDGWQNEIYRGGVHFDLSSLSHRKIHSAKLHVQVEMSFLDGAATNQRTSCASSIGTAMAYWWNSSEWIEANSRLRPGETNGPDVAYDVTPIVADWANGIQNFGFVLMSDVEDLNAFTTEQCITSYTSTISLEVKYSGLTQDPTPRKDER